MDNLYCIPFYPFLFLLELLGHAIWDILPYRPVVEWILGLAAMVAFTSLIVLAAKRQLRRIPSERRSPLRSILAVFLLLLLLAIVTFPVSVAWAGFIQMRYSFECDPILEYNPFGPPLIADSVLKGDNWVDYRNGASWAGPARTGA
jgi:hypothetical protein